MASYELGPDGLLRVTQDDGTVLPGMTPDMAPQLEAMGVTRAAGAPSSGSTPPGEGGGGSFWDRMNTAFSQPPSIPVANAPAASIGTMRQAPAARGGAAPPKTSAEMGEKSVDVPEPAAAPARERPKTTSIEIGGGMGGPATPTRRGSPARFVDQPLSELRTTSRQVEHSPYSQLSDEEIQARLLPLDEQKSDLSYQHQRGRLLQREMELNAKESQMLRGRLMEREHQRQAELNKRTRLFDKMRQVHDEEVRAAAVDPKRYFRDMGMGTKLLAVLASGLQGYQMGMMGQPGLPPMIGLLQELNQQDIDDQKLKYEDAVKRGEQAENRYQEALRMWGDPDAAEMQMERDKLALSEEYLNRQMQFKAGDMDAAAQFEAAKAQLQERRQQLEDELSIRGRARVVDSMQATPKVLTGGGGGGSAANNLRSRAVRVGGNVFFAPDPATAKKVGEGVVAAEGAIDLIRDIRKLRKESGFGERLLGTGKGAELQGKVNRLLIQTNKAEGLGALDKGSVEILRDAIGSADDAIEWGADEKLGAMEADLQRNMRRNVSQFLSEDPEGTVLPDRPVEEQ